MCFYRTKLYKACGHTEFRRFMCHPAPTSNIRHPPDHNGPVYIKSHFACGEPPQHVNDLELGVCGHCRKARHPNKGVGRRSAALENKPTRVQPSIRIFVPESDADEVKHGDKGFQQAVIPIFLPESDAKEANCDEKTEDVEALSADAIEERRLFKQSVVEAVEECRQLREEIEEDQAKASSLLDAIGILGKKRPMSDKRDISNEHPPRPKHAKVESLPPQTRSVNPRPLSHSVTKVRRDLNAAKGRARSMINTLNSKSEANPVINSMNHKSMVRLVNTISRNSEPDHAAKPEAPIIPKRQESVGRPLPPYPYPDPRTLPKSEKLNHLAKHHYHRLVPIAEESTCQSLVVVNSAANTVVLRRVKAVQLRNLNAFHCPVRQPRFGLKRKVLAPPVPRHLTPPVAVPFSKFADLGRRRVSEAEWCFVV